MRSYKNKFFYKINYILRSQKKNKTSKSCNTSLYIYESPKNKNLNTRKHVIGDKFLFTFIYSIYINDFFFFKKKIDMKSYFIPITLIDMKFL